MKELRGTHYGQRKFRCARCGRVKMQRASNRRKTELGHEA